MQKGDLALIVRDCGWQGDTVLGNAIGFIVEIISFDASTKGYATKLVVPNYYYHTWWCMEEEICKIPEELKNEPIEVIKLYCNL